MARKTITIAAVLHAALAIVALGGPARAQDGETTSLALPDLFFMQGAAPEAAAELDTWSVDSLAFRRDGKSEPGSFDGCRSDLALGGSRWFTDPHGLTLTGEDEPEPGETAPAQWVDELGDESAWQSAPASGFVRWRNGRWGRCSAAPGADTGFRATHSIDPQGANASIFLDQALGPRTIHAEYRFEHAGPANVASSISHGLRLRTDLRRGARSQTRVAYEVQLRPAVRQYGPFSLRDALSLEHSVSLPLNQRLLLGGTFGRERDGASGVVLSRDFDQLGISGGYELKLPLVDLKTRIDAGLQMRRFSELRGAGGEDRLRERYQSGGVSLVRPIGVSSVFVYYRRERGDSNATLADFDRSMIGLTFTRPL
jgi:hypothetical protein